MVTAMLLLQQCSPLDNKRSVFHYVQLRRNVLGTSFLPTLLRLSLQELFWSRKINKVGGIPCVNVQMTKSGQSVAVLTRKQYSEVSDVATSLMHHLNKAGFRVYTNISLKSGSVEYVESIKDMKRLKPNLLVSIGGDGTLLWVIREMDGETPILGVNVGGRGVLAEVKPEKVSQAVEWLSKGEYVLEERFRLVASVGLTTLPPALNEVYMTRLSQIRTSTFTITVNGDTIKQRMDGLIVSTPTGSTGHSLSFGSPFIHPAVQALLLMPIAPLNRLPSIILPVGPVEVVSNFDIALVIDGQEEMVVHAQDKVLIKKHAQSARFVRFKGQGLQQLVNLGF